MPDVAIVFDDLTPPRSIVAMMEAIRQTAPAREIDSLHTSQLSPTLDARITYCWLTLDPHHHHNYTDLSILRQLATSTTAIETGDGGNLYLPAIWTARGPIYGEAIALRDVDKYDFPFHLEDDRRQPLYNLTYQLLSSIQAEPGVYLVLVRELDAGWMFDRILPFPAPPALASIGKQSPDLFTCHWLCLDRQPLLDVYCQ
jgi:hypothetical protein